MTEDITPNTPEALAKWMKSHYYETEPMLCLGVDGLSMTAQVYKRVGSHSGGHRFAIAIGMSGKIEIQYANDITDLSHRLSLLVPIIECGFKSRELQALENKKPRKDAHPG